MIQLFKSFSGKGHGDSCWWGHSWVSFLSDLLSNQLGKKLVKCAERSQRVIFKMANNLFRKIMQSASVKWTKTWKKQWHPVAFQRFQHVLASQFSPERRFASSPVMTSCSLRLIKMLPVTQLSAMDTSGLEWRRTSRWASFTAGEIRNGFPFPVEKR